MRQLSLFKSRRQRGRAPPPPLEFESHCVLADIIKRWIMPQWRFTHIPLGEQRTKATAARLARMGVRPGWPDFQFAGPQCRMFFLELKRRGSGRLSESQADMVSHLAACGFDILVTDSVEDAVETLKALGILKATVSVQ